MTSSPEVKPNPSSPPLTFGAWLRTMPTWKKVTVAVALLAAIGGAVASFAAGDAPVTAGGGNLSGMSNSLLPGQPGSGNTTTAAAEPAAKGVFRLGFSFLAGFCIGSFIRAAIKVAAIAFGFWLFLTFVLSQYGILTVDWNAIGSLWDRFAAAVEQEWGDFQRFMTGSLPAAGLAATGLVIGLKRH
ncbi:MAG: FUN14 domain-containing protein [Planctomycetes bacterium]|nr:FUN14 domain-containing protein [Planctomycetota bacterium]